MAKFCTKCGNQLNEGDLFCSNCGNRVDSRQSVVPNAPQQQSTDAPQTSESSFVRPQQQGMNAPQSSESSFVRPQQQGMNAPQTSESSFVRPQQQGMNTAAVVPRKKGKKGKKGLIIGISVAVVAVLAAGAVLLYFVFGVFGDRGYEAAIDNVLKIDEAIFNEGVDGINTDDFRTLAPDEFWDSLESQSDMDYYEIVDEFRDYIQNDEDDYKDIADAYGGYIRISSDITDVQHLSSAMVSELADKLSSQYDISEKPVTDAYKVKCNLTFKGDTGRKTGRATFYCVKFDGEWYACDRTFRLVDVIITCINSFDFSTDLY